MVEVAGQFEVVRSYDSLERPANHAVTVLLYDCDSRRFRIIEEFYPAIGTRSIGTVAGCVEEHGKHLPDDGGFAASLLKAAKDEAWEEGGENGEEQSLLRYCRTRLNLTRHF
jgi:hypothetical protein